MKISITNKKNEKDIHLFIIGATTSSVKTDDVFKQFKNEFHFKHFSAKRGESVDAHDEKGNKYLIIGLGDEKKLCNESLRKEWGTLTKKLSGSKFSHVCVALASFKVESLENTLEIIVEAIGMTNYKFDKYLSDKKQSTLKEIQFYINSADLKKFKAIVDSTELLTGSITFAKNLVNEAPNVLNSETCAKFVAEDVKKNLSSKTVSLKIFDKKMIEKEKMNLFLSVNSGSAYEPRLVHLTYTPAKKTKNMKHLCLVGKGVTFDTGGYSLKPATSMVNMKYDMAGSATVYGAFRAAVLQECPHKISCFMVLTDNAINSMATKPDSIVIGRNGKSVEILNTDAEGRLILADVLDYACDLKPDAIVDVATLTGACLVALGSEICGLMSNCEKLTEEIKNAAKTKNEYVWQLPIIEEFRNDVKADIADLRNMAKTSFGGTPKAAAFLENFIKNDISWVHLDIAGIGDSQSHLSYCQPKGASGLIIRTLHTWLMSK